MSQTKKKLTFFHALIKPGIANMAFLLFSILFTQKLLASSKHFVFHVALNGQKPSKRNMSNPKKIGGEDSHVPCNHVSLISMTLDLLSHTSTLDPQSVLYTISKPGISSLARFWQQLFHAIHTRHLDQICLPPGRVHGILPLSRRGILIRSERVWSLLLKVRLGGTRGLEGCWRPSCEESEQRRGKLLRQPDVLGGGGWD